MVRTVAIAGIATPSFWLGILSILLVLDVTQRDLRHAVDAADRLRAALEGPAAQPVDGDSGRRSPSATAIPR